MTHITLTLSNYLANPISEVIRFLGLMVDSFMNSKFMKAWEKAAKARVKKIIARSTIRELSSLSDTQLKDIGLSRSDITYVAHNGFDR